MRDDAAHFHRFQRLTAVFMLSFLGIALSLGWWGAVQRAELAERPDNPRTVEAELRIERGRIFDNSGNLVLAQTVADGERLRRMYPLTVTAPAVGYYSFRYGTVGVEQGVDDILRGEAEGGWADLWRDLLNEPQRGRDVRLTLDAAWQANASNLLGERQGAVLLLTIPDGAVRVLVSHPLYDPNLLDSQFDQLAADQTAPLLNRVTQAQYQPGLVLEPFVLAAAVDQGLLRLEDVVDAPNRPIEVGGIALTCLTEPETADWVGVLGSACPAPLGDLAPQFGVAGLTELFATFGFANAPSMPYVPVAEVPPSVIQDPTAAIIGQENLLVSPLQVGLALATFGNGGMPIQARLVSAVQDEAGEWAGTASDAAARVPLVTAETAVQIRESLPQWERAREYNTLVLSGPDGDMNGWYLGLAPITEPRYALVVVVEDAADGDVAREIGRELLQMILEN